MEPYRAGIDMLSGTKLDEGLPGGVFGGRVVSVGLGTFPEGQMDLDEYHSFSVTGSIIARGEDCERQSSPVSLPEFVFFYF
jgi:hypothetical protein